MLSISLIERRTTSLSVGKLNKNGEGRLLVLEGSVRALIEERWAKHPPECPWVFETNGQRLKKDQRHPWEKACLATGLSEVLRDEHEEPILDAQGQVQRVKTRTFHDLRRSAAMNLVNNGVLEREAMAISGAPHEKRVR